MVSAVEEAATRCVTLPPSPVLKASLKRSLPPPMSLVMTDGLPDEISLDNLKAVLPTSKNGESGATNGNVKYGDSHGAVKSNKNFVLGRDMHGSSFKITEPDHDDEVTGEKDAYMASVLARYRKSLTEKSKYHLGGQTCTDFALPLTDISAVS